MTDGRGLAFLNKIQALHCEGFHCKGSSAFTDSRCRYVARQGKVLGQTDQNLPCGNSWFHRYPCKPDRVVETRLGTVHTYPYLSEVLFLFLPTSKPVTLTSNQQTGRGTSLVLSKEHSSLRSNVWIWLVFHSPSITFRIGTSTRERTLSIGGHCHGR